MRIAASSAVTAASSISAPVLTHRRILLSAVRKPLKQLKKPGLRVAAALKAYHTLTVNKCQRSHLFTTDLRLTFHEHFRHPHVRIDTAAANASAQLRALLIRPTAECSPPPPGIFALIYIHTLNRSWLDALLHIPPTEKYHPAAADTAKPDILSYPKHLPHETAAWMLLLHLDPVPYIQHDQGRNTPSTAPMLSVITRSASLSMGVADLFIRTSFLPL